MILNWYEILRAIAIEIKKIGFSIILGPVLDVVTKLSHQLVGVRVLEPSLKMWLNMDVCVPRVTGWRVVYRGETFPRYWKRYC